MFDAERRPNERVYRIAPVFEARIWGGRHLIEKYGYRTDLPNIAESYCCVSIPGHLDCDVIDTGEKLSSFFLNHQNLFSCDTDRLPIRMTVESVVEDMSVQIHPENDYALEHFKQFGKPGGILYLEGARSRLLLGHHAATREQFVAWSKHHQFERLFRFIDFVPGDFIHIPTNTLHSFRIRGIMIAFARNSDVTLRLYDYGRKNLKTNESRELHVAAVCENVIVPDDQLFPTCGDTVSSGGLVHTILHDVPGEYTAGRVVTRTPAKITIDSFYFILCVNGCGTIAGRAIKMGDVLFVPCGHGSLLISGDLDFVYCSYKNRDPLHKN